MAEEVFRRVEQKYILSKEQKQELIKKLKEYIVPSEYPFSTICNIYYDTDDYYLIRNSIEKPIYKEKVRIRSYGIPDLETNIFMEIKKKYSGVVGKRRINIKLKEAKEYLENGKFPNTNKQIMNEIDYCFKRYNLKPSIFLAYERYAYVEKDNSNFRITFDTNLRSRNYDLVLEKGDYGESLFNEEIYIMEVKTLGALPLWFVDIISNLKIYPGSFSKYGRIYQEKLKCS